jgi:hypothetical protein
VLSQACVSFAMVKWESREGEKKAKFFWSNAYSTTAVLLRSVGRISKRSNSFLSKWRLMSRSTRCRLNSINSITKNLTTMLDVIITLKRL